MSIKNLRTIRRFQSLAQSDITDVTTYNFRSLKEAEAYADELMRSAMEDVAEIKKFKALFEPASVRALMRLNAVVSGIRTMRVIRTDAPKPGTPAPKAKIKEGQSIPVEFNAPASKEMVKKYKALNRLLTKIETLDVFIAKVAEDFSDEPAMTGKFTKELKAKRKVLQTALDDAYKFMQTTAKKTEPKQFKLACKHLVAKVVETFKDSFGSYTEYVYVTPKVGDKGDIAFEYNHYLELTNFRSDEDAVFSKYFIVFTGIVKTPANHLTMYFTTLTHFAPPGRFKPQVQFTKEANGWHDLLIALEAESFSTFIERVPLGVTKTQLKKTSWGVPSEMIVDMGIENDVITFALNGKLVKDAKTAQTIQNVINKNLILKTVPPNKGTVKVRTAYKSGANWILDFVVVKPSRQHLKEIRIDQDMVDTFAQRFNWTPQQATKFVRTFNKMVDEDLAEDEGPEGTGTKAQPKPAAKTPVVKEEAPPQDKVAKIKEIIPAVLTAVGIAFKLNGVEKVVTPTVVPNVTKERFAAALTPRLKGTGLKLHGVRVDPELVTIFFENVKASEGTKRYIVKIGDGIPLRVTW